MSQTDDQPASICEPAPFIPREYATADGSAWYAIDPSTGIVVSTASQEAASHAADALNAAYRLGSRMRWCDTVPAEYALAASELMGAAENASCGFDALADECLVNAQNALAAIRGK